jgi:chorismate mutase
MAVRALRGATQVDEDDREQVLAATTSCSRRCCAKTALQHDDLISVIFTATPDIRPSSPAYAARQMGITDVPLLCASEIDVPGAMPRVLRLLAHVETDRSRARGASRLPARRCALRTDLPR